MPRLQNYAPKKVVPEPGNTMTSDTAFAYFSFSRKTPEIEIMKAFRHRRLLEAGDASQPIIYLELRKDGYPVDPGPWGGVNEGQKVC
jgi:hypothetical protein